MGIPHWGNPIAEDFGVYVWEELVPVRKFFKIKDFQILGEEKRDENLLNWGFPQALSSLSIFKWNLTKKKKLRKS